MVKLIEKKPVLQASNHRRQLFQCPELSQKGVGSFHILGDAHKCFAKAHGLTFTIKRDEIGDLTSLARVRKNGGLFEFSTNEQAEEFAIGRGGSEGNMDFTINSVNDVLETPQPQ